jgi:hypothetical protein
MALVGVIGWPQETNVELVAAWRDRGIPAVLVSPALASSLLGAGDVAVGRPLPRGAVYVRESRTLPPLPHR